MAQIDTSIPMGFRPIQIESPINQMAAISQLENARQQQQMNMLQMQEYKRKTKDDEELSLQRNALAQIHSNLPPGIKIGSQEYLNLVASKAPRFLTDIMDQQTKREGFVAQREEREARTQEREFQLDQKKDQISREKVNKAIADIAGFDDLASIQSDIERKLTSGELTEEQANKMRAGLPADDSGIPDWQRRTLMSLMDLKERVAAMRDEGKPIVVEGNLVSPTGRVIYEGDRKPVSVAPGGQLINPKTGEVIFTSPDRPVSIAPGGQLIDPVTGEVKFTAAAAAPPPTPAQRDYQAAVDAGFEGSFTDFLDQQKETEMEREWRRAKAEGYKGSFLDWKKANKQATNISVNNPAPVQTLMVQGKNGPEMRDARTGRLITDDKGQPLRPYDASNKPLSPVQQQKLKKDRLADDAKITSAKDMADDIEKNVDALLGNEKKKIKPHPGLQGITGYNALIPSLPGGQPRAAQQLLDSVKGKVTQVGKSLASQEGKLGNMAVQEWKIVADAVERIDPAAPNFADQLRSVVSQARRLETNLKSRRDAAYADDQPAAPNNSVYDAADAVLRK
jgi:hypothetical protein